MLYNRRGIRCQKCFTVGYAYNQRRTFACGYYSVGRVGTDNRYGISANNLFKSFAYGIQQAAPGRTVYVLYKFYYHFGICIGIKYATVLFQRLLKNGVVFYGAVMYNGYAPVCTEMRMGVRVVRLAVRCPSRVCYTDCPGNVFRLAKPFKFADLSMRLINIQSVLCVNQSHAGTVVTAVFQSVQSFCQDRECLLDTYISYYSAHINYLFYPRKVNYFAQTLQNKFKRLLNS